MEKEDQQIAEKEQRVFKARPIPSTQYAPETVVREERTFVEVRCNDGYLLFAIVIFFFAIFIANNIIRREILCWHLILEQRKEKNLSSDRKREKHKK
jgi:hypothetical protein